MIADHGAVGDLAKMSAWSEESLGYARLHGQRRLARLLEAVGVEIEMEKALLPLASGEHLSSGRVARTAASRKDGRMIDGARNVASDEANDALQRRKAEEKNRLRIAAWELFMQEELRELELRRDGQLARLLGEALPGESPGALLRLADEDRRQAQEGTVALMSNGKVSYKPMDDLSEGDMPARIAASRARTTWLKERRDGWLRRDGGLRGEL